MTIPKVPMQLLVEQSEHRADLHISGDITSGVMFWGMRFKEDDDVDYNDVAEVLADLPDDITDITVHINSYGGEVAQGVAIYNALKAHPAKVTTVCEGFACSIASVVFMAGSERVMRDSSLLMLHNASMPSCGDANAHRKVAADLDVITELSKTAYLSRATEALTPEKLAELMDAETWVTPEQALEWGLATAIDAPEDDGDEPTQSAGRIVFGTLAGMPESITESFNFVGDFERLFTQMDELKQLIIGQQQPEPIQDPAPSALPRERYSRIFQELSQE